MDDRGVKDGVRDLVCPEETLRERLYARDLDSEIVGEIDLVTDIDGVTDGVRVLVCPEEALKEGYGVVLTVNEGVGPPS